MNPGQLGRIMLLVIVFGFSLPVLVNSVWSPTRGTRYASPSFKFRDEVPLPTWTQVKSEPATSLALKGIAVNGYQYRYSRDGQALAIEMHYLAGNSEEGDIFRLLQTYDSISVSPQEMVIRQRSDIGYYTLFAQQKSAYLSACLNPHGISTVTESQFQYNSTTSLLNLNQVLLWLEGRRPLRDRRCLWVVMKLPTDKLKLEQTYSVLENAWFNWFRWWQQHFFSLSYFIF